MEQELLSDRNFTNFLDPWCLLIITEIKIDKRDYLLTVQQTLTQPKMEAEKAKITEDATIPNITVNRVVMDPNCSQSFKSRKNKIFTGVFSFNLKVISLMASSLRRVFADIMVVVMYET